MLAANRAENFVDSGIKILIAVVIGALLLGGLYAPDPQASAITPIMIAIITTVKMIDPLSDSFSTHSDLCFPTTPELRKQLNTAVAEAYKQAIVQLQEQTAANFTQSERLTRYLIHFRHILRLL